MKKYLIFIILDTHKNTCVSPSNLNCMFLLLSSHDFLVLIMLFLYGDSIKVQHTLTSLHLYQSFNIPLFFLVGITMLVRKHVHFNFHHYMVYSFIKKLQQARVIEDSLDFKVGIYCGSSNQFKNHRDWEKDMEQYEVIMLVD